MIPPEALVVVQEVPLLTGYGTLVTRTELGKPAEGPVSCEEKVLA